MSLARLAMRIADAIDERRAERGLPPCIVVWENVPGVLSVRDNAFGCFLSGLSGEDTPFVPPRGKWTNAGVALGPARAVAWRILDAQFFGLAQRRRRVFVVASARAGFDPAAVLLEFEGLRRDSPPRREARQDPAARAALRTDERRSHWDGIEHPHPTLNQSFNTGAIGYSNQELFSQRGAGLVGEASTGDVSHCLNAGGMGRQDYETETLVTHPLRAEGFDASEDGTGRGTPLVPVAFSAKDHGADATQDLSPRFEITLTEAEWRERLTPEQYAILRDHGTEHAFSSPLDKETRPGMYHCGGCDQAVYSSEKKYDLGTGWPSFWDSEPRAIGTMEDRSLFMVRTECHCSRCGGHLGHIFDDGPAPTRKRHCINGLAMSFVPTDAPA